MDAAFWHDCWQQNKLGFQLEQPHPLLQKWLPKVLTAGHSFTEIVLPLCGKSPDLLYCREHLPVLGIELSEIACKAFFSENQLAYQYQAANPELNVPHNYFKSDNIQLAQGDFFSYPDKQLAARSLIYDRAALIALPESMRQPYAAKLARWVAQGASLLLISLEYPPVEKRGPPFTVPETEVRELFANCTVALLEACEITGQGFARRRFATSFLVEKIYLISQA